jgi:hypothetical protein
VKVEIACRVVVNSFGCDGEKDDRLSQMTALLWLVEFRILSILFRTHIIVNMRVNVIVQAGSLVFDFELLP